MRCTTPRITMLLCAAISTALIGCGGTAPRPSPTLLLTQGDRTRTPDPDKPALPASLPKVEGPAAAERAYLWAVVIQPLLDVSLAQEAAKQKEGQRADGVVAKVDAYNKAVAPKGWRWPWDRTP